MAFLFLLLPKLIVAFTSSQAILRLSDYENWYLRKFQLRASPSFDELKSFENRLNKIDEDSPDLICSFYDENLASFSVQPGVKRFSVTSTCFALQAILSAKGRFSNSVCFDMSGRLSGCTQSNTESKIPLRIVVDALLNASWREEDLFQVPLVLETILMLDQKLNCGESEKLDEATTSKMKALVSALLEARPMRRAGRSQPLSDYLQFRCAQALLRLSKSLFSVKKSTDDLGNERVCVAGLGQLYIDDLPDQIEKELSFIFAR